MPEPREPLGAAQYLPRILTVAVGAVCVWLLFQTLVAPSGLPNAWTQRQMEPYLTALSSGDNAKARAVFDRDIRANSAEPGVYGVIAQACIQTDRYDLALEYLDRGVAACKNAPRQGRASLYLLMFECYTHTEKTKPQKN